MNMAVKTRSVHIKNKVGESIWCIRIIDMYSFYVFLFTLTHLDRYF